MGKFGGRELNVSSDIDLIFIYPEEGKTQGQRAISNHEYLTLLEKKLIARLNDITKDGFVFRVVMRLSPYGDSVARKGWDTLTHHGISTTLYQSLTFS